MSLRYSLKLPSLLLLHLLQRHGHGTMVYADHSTYSGEWKLDLREGRGELVIADGSTYQGQWLNDKFHGRGMLQMPAASYTYTGEGALQHCMLEVMAFLFSYKLFKSVN